MATISSAQAKWERNTQGKGGKWKAAVEHGDYCGGMASFLGVRPNRMCADYAAGVGAVSASAFDASIAGKGSKWAEGLRRAAAL